VFLALHGKEWENCLHQQPRVICRYRYFISELISLLSISFEEDKYTTFSTKMQHRTLQSTLVTALLLATQTSSHFLLNYPNTVGFSDDNEGTAPCGGFNVTFDNATSFHVDGDAIAVTSTHPQAEWLFRATLDKTGTGDNFTNLLPVVSEAGLGSYCEPGLTVPGTWAGSDGVIQVIQHGPDGSLFQVKHAYN